MAEIKKGSFTLPGEAGFESLTLKMAEKLQEYSLTWEVTNEEQTSFVTAMARSFLKILQRQGMVFTLRFA